MQQHYYPFQQEAGIFFCQGSSTLFNTCCVTHFRVRNCGHQARMGSRVGGCQLPVAGYQLPVAG